MSKKKTISTTKEFLQKFLNEKNYGIWNDGYATCYTIRKQKYKDEKIHDFYNDDFLSATINDVNKEGFIEFLVFLLEQKENDCVLYQAIKKTPIAKSYEYSTTVKDIVLSLLSTPEVLFSYVSRINFLDSSWSSLEELGVFNVLNSEQKNTIFELLIHTKSFNQLDNQKNIYNLLNKHIENTEKLLPYFNKIKTIDENKDVVIFTKESSVVILGLTKDNLIGANLNTSITSEKLIQYITKYSTLMKELFNELKIDNVFMDFKNNMYLLNILCDSDAVDLNKNVFNKMINDICRTSNIEELNQFTFNGTLDLILKESKIKTLHKNLNNNLTENNTIKNKSKI